MSVFDQMKRDAIGAVKTIWGGLTDPEGTIEGKGRDPNEVIFSSGACETCGDRPFARFDGLVVACPTCKVLR